MGVILRFCYIQVHILQTVHPQIVCELHQAASAFAKPFFSQKGFDYEVVKCRLTGVISEEAVLHGEEC